MLRDDQTEVEIMETIDYGETDLHSIIEGDANSYNYENESLGQRGYTTQEFDENSEELVSVEEEIELKEDFGPEDLGVMEPIDSID